MNYKILRYGQITDAGIIVLRLWLGITMVKYSFPVVFNNGFTEFGDWLGSMNFPLPYFLAYCAKGGEFIGGILLVLGLFTRISSVFIMINMVVAALIVGQAKIFEGAELAFTYLLIATMVFLLGPDRLSLDTILGSGNNERRLS
ncbi:MAG: DoxX family protein [Cyclobacteriaceae bacterium]